MLFCEILGPIQYCNAQAALNAGRFCVEPHRGGDCYVEAMCAEMMAEIGVGDYRTNPYKGATDGCDQLVVGVTSAARRWGFVRRRIDHRAT